MSSEMWSRDHSETGRHGPSPNSHHSSIIHPGFHLCDEDFYFEVRFIFHVLKRRVAAFMLTKDICVCSIVEEVLHVEVQGFEVEPSRVAHIVTEQRENMETLLTPS